jgi:Xaa-Pro aminopeptidase
MAQMIYTPESEIVNRIQNVQIEMAKKSLDGLIITHHTNLFYFSGTSQSCHLFIPQKGKPLLMVRKSFERALQESGIEQIIELNSLKQMFPNILDNVGSTIKTLGLELDIIPYNTFVLYQKKIFPDVEIKDASNIIKQVRWIKSQYEIDLLKHSCNVLDQAFTKVPGMLYEGMTEIELASLFEGQMRKNGYGGCCKMRAFNQDFLFGNLVSGASGSVPSYFDGPVGGQGLSPANNPHGAGWKKIKRNEPVYIDYTCVVNGYTADAERIFAMGNLSDELVHAQKTALTIQDEMIKKIRPGINGAEIWDLSARIAEEEGLLNHYMGYGKDRVKFVGHGVGLELDEMPVFAKGFEMILKPGMTFALEPKFVFDQGAVGIENTFLLTQNGVEKLNDFKENIIYT